MTPADRAEQGVEQLKLVFALMRAGSCASGAVRIGAASRPGYDPPVP